LIKQRKMFQSGVFGNAVGTPDEHTQRLVRRLSRVGMERKVTDEDCMSPAANDEESLSPPESRQQ